MELKSKNRITLTIAVISLGLLVSCTGGNSSENRELKQQVAQLKQEVAELKKQGSYTPGLGEIMSNIQSRHIKLQYAATQSNWSLAELQIEELEELMEDVIKYHPEHDEVALDKLIPQMIMPSIEQVEEAVLSNDISEFNKTYKTLTQNCNNCHAAAKHSMVQIQIPKPGAFPNQNFAAKN